MVSRFLAPRCTQRCANRVGVSGSQGSGALEGASGWGGGSTGFSWAVGLGSFGAHKGPKASTVASEDRICSSSRTFERGLVGAKCSQN